MLPPLPKKALKLSRSTIKRATMSTPKVRDVQTAEKAADDMGLVRGYLKRGKPYTPLRAAADATAQD